jgi:hypothetical protein
LDGNIYVIHGKGQSGTSALGVDVEACVAGSVAQYVIEGSSCVGLLDIWWSPGDGTQAVVNSQNEITKMKLTLDICRR